MIEHHIYIGKWPDCGCVTAACVDNPAHKKDTAKFITELVKDGRIIERISPEDWHKIKLGRCVHRSQSGKTPHGYGNPSVVQQLLDISKQ